MTRRQGGDAAIADSAAGAGAAQALPRILFSPAEADRLVAALRTHRDRAMVLAMLLAGLRRCEVLGLRFTDVQVADRRLVVTEGKGGHRRVVPAEGGEPVLRRAGRIPARRAACRGGHGPGVRGAEGPAARAAAVGGGTWMRILAGARRRAGLEPSRYVPSAAASRRLTRLREAGIALEAVQAQAGHRSIEVDAGFTCAWPTTGSPKSTPAGAAELIDAEQERGAAAMLAVQEGVTGS